MIYIMSDIHGCYNTFTKMLNQIEFSKKDTLYILGDVIDRGKYGVEMLKYIMSHENIKMIIGNHEYLMLDELRHNGEWHQEPIELWTEYNGGTPTYKALHKLQESERETILDFIESLPYEITIDLNGKRYLLVHGRPNLTDAEREKAEKSYDSFYSPHQGRFEQVWGHFLPYTIIRPETIIFGHTMTPRYSEQYPASILFRNGNIGVDCGCTFQNWRGRLGCLRLNDMSTFYQKIDARDIPRNRNIFAVHDPKPRRTKSGFEYEIAEDETVRITRYIGDPKRMSMYDFEMIHQGFDIPKELQSDLECKVTVPAVIAGMPVKSIGNDRYGLSGFGGCLNVTAVVLPDGLQEICSSAFEGCIKLRHIKMPDSITKIGENAFLGCNNLETTAIPKAPEKYCTQTEGK